MYWLEIDRGGCKKRDSVLISLVPLPKINFGKDTIVCGAVNLILNAKETALHDLARLRIAGILLDDGKYDDALRTISAPHGDSFAGLYLDRKGDILVATNKLSEARLSYQEAISKLSKTNTYFNIVQMKLDALGESD